jgi:hypothetical protein
MRATFIISGVIVALGLCAPAQAARERRVVAMEYAKVDLQALANQVASAARRCWLTRSPDLGHFKFERIERGADASSFRVVFSDSAKSKVLLPRHFEMIVSTSGPATLITVEQEGIDFRDAIGRDAETLIKGRVVTC